MLRHQKWGVSAGANSRQQERTTTGNRKPPITLGLPLLSLLRKQSPGAPRTVTCHYLGIFSRPGLVSKS